MKITYKDPTFGKVTVEGDEGALLQMCIAFKEAAKWNAATGHQSVTTILNKIGRNIHNELFNKD